MNYSNHSLKISLEEWKDRLSNANDSQFSKQLQYLMTNFEQNSTLASLLHDACSNYTYTLEYLNSISEELHYQLDEVEFENEKQHAAFCIQLIKHLISDFGYKLHINLLGEIAGDGLDQVQAKIVQDLIEPVVYYLNDNLQKSTSVIYLLEKYKRRVEWFTKDSLATLYTRANKNYEKIFEDDLRLFLFDQGIDYPFSTPSSPSGRGDIIGEIDTEDPIIIEIKILDADKGYGKERIKSGFTQVVKYTSDYNKDAGFLVIFNMDDTEVRFSNMDSSKFFPPSLTLNNKTYYFVVINCASTVSASKAGTLKITDVDVNELSKL